MPVTATRRGKPMTTQVTNIRRMIITVMVTTTPTAIITMNMAVMIISTAIPMLMSVDKRSRRCAARATAGPGKDIAAGSNALPNAEAVSLYRLLTWLSPSFPVGAFSYSSGIEWAVESGDITDASSLQAWLDAMLTIGSGFCDGVFLAQTHGAVSGGEEAALNRIAELACAFAPSRERHLETTAQGKAFIDIARAAWSSPSLDRLVGCCSSPIPYPVAVGVVSAAHRLPLAPTIHAFLHAVISNGISAATRLVPLGQTDAQHVLARLEPAVVETANRILEASLEELGSATFRADLASLRHEAQYTRLFRS